MLLINSGTPVRRTKRRTTQQMHVHKFWGSGSQDNTLKISTNALSEIRGLQFAEHSVGNLTNIHFQKIWDSGSQNTPSEISESHTFRNYGTPVRRTTRQKSQIKCTPNIHGSPIRRATRRSQQMHFLTFWYSRSQNKTSEIASNPLSEILGLQFAEQTVGNLET